MVIHLLIFTHFFICPITHLCTIFFFIDYKTNPCIETKLTVMESFKLTAAQKRSISLSHLY